MSMDSGGICVDGLSAEFINALQELIRVHNRQINLIQNEGRAKLPPIAKNSPSSRYNSHNSGASVFSFSAPRVISLGLAPTLPVLELADDSGQSKNITSSFNNPVRQEREPADIGMDLVLARSAGEKLNDVKTRSRSRDAGSSNSGGTQSPRSPATNHNSNGLALGKADGLHDTWEAQSNATSREAPRGLSEESGPGSCRYVSGGLSGFGQEMFGARSSPKSPGLGYPLHDVHEVVMVDGENGTPAATNTQKKIGHSSFSRRLYSVHFALEDPERTSWKASMLVVIIPILVCLNIVCALFQAIDPCPIDRSFLRILDLSLNGVFLVEALIRLIVYPKTRFFVRFSSSQVFLLIDIAAAIPFGLFVSHEFARPLEDPDEPFGAQRFLFLCICPFLRLLKILRYTRNVHLLTHALFLLLEAVPSMMFIMVVITWFFASLLVLVEPVDNVKSLPHAIWMCVITMTTVGYGDVYPTAIGGYLICGTLAVSSLLYMAMPLGIIGNIFTSVWDDRHRLLLTHKVRTRLAQAGYSPKDIPEVFSRFDANGTGQLDVFAFRDLIETIDIGLDEKKIHELFNDFDVDENGSIDAAEFLRFLFPKTFHELYGAPKNAETAP